MNFEEISISKTNIGGGPHTPGVNILVGVTGKG